MDDFGTTMRRLHGASADSSEGVNLLKNEGATSIGAASTASSWWLPPPPNPTPQELGCSLQKLVNFQYTRLAPESPPGLLDKRRRTCAVVSSSGVLLNHEHGRKIDDAELVARFNDAPVRDFERHVGTRTDLRVVNDADIDSKLANAGADETMQEGFMVVPIDVMRSAVPRRPRIREPYPVQELIMAEPELMTSLADALLKSFSEEYFVTGQEIIPTSGGTAMMILLNQCDSVHAYGMARSVEDDTAGYHYYPPETSAGFHATFNAEKELWRHLAENSYEDIDGTSIAVIPGFSTYSCPANPPRAVIHYPISQTERIIFFAVGFALAIALLPFSGWAFWQWRRRRAAEAGAASAALGAAGPRPDSPQRGMAYMALVAYTSWLLIVDAANTATNAWVCTSWCAWEPLHIMLMAEVVKALVCLAETGLRATPVQAPWTELALRQAPVALIYAGNSFLLLHVIANTDASLFVAWRSLAVPISLLLRSAWLKRRPDIMHWVVVAAVLISVCLNQVSLDGVWLPAVWGGLPYPLLYAVLSAFLASVAAAMNEVTMKTSHLQRAFSISSMNMVLYLETALALLILSVIPVLTGPFRLREIFDWVPLGLIVAQAALGLTVSRVLAHADCVAKSVAGGARDVAALAVQPIILGWQELYWQRAFSGFWMLAGIIVYFVLAPTYRMWDVEADKNPAQDR